jgi:hypothetical protein
MALSASTPARLQTTTNSMPQRIKQVNNQSEKPKGSQPSNMRNSETKLDANVCAVSLITISGTITTIIVNTKTRQQVPSSPASLITMFIATPTHVPVNDCNNNIRP